MTSKPNPPLTSSDVASRAHLQEVRSTASDRTPQSDGRAKPAGYSDKRARARKGDPLTLRELEILALLAAGNTTSDIARELGITQGTIKTHLTAVYRKVGATNRIQATLHYLARYGTPPETPAPAGK